jgi:hypothetical protein
LSPRSVASFSKTGFRAPMETLTAMPAAAIDLSSSGPCARSASVEPASFLLSPPPDFLSLVLQISRGWRQLRMRNRYGDRCAQINTSLEHYLSIYL